MPDPTQQLDEILARCEKATEEVARGAEELTLHGFDGKTYKTCRYCHKNGVHGLGILWAEQGSRMKVTGHADDCPLALLIAHARTDLPRLAKALRAVLNLEEVEQRSADQITPRHNARISAFREVRDKISAALGGQDEQA